MRAKQAGFSMIELVMVIAILSILAAMAVPKFESSAVKVRSAAEVLVADIRLAQSLAIRQNNANVVLFDLDAHGYTISDQSGVVKTVVFGEGAYAPLGGLALANGQDFSFDRTGAPTVGPQDIRVEVDGGEGSFLVVHVNAQTGRAGITGIT